MIGEGLSQKYTYKEFLTERKIGEILVSLPKPPPKEEIDNHDLPKKQQRFLPTDIPSDSEILDNWSNDKRERFVDREWDRRRNGYWFFNNGNLEYITGVHYFYLTYWKMPVVINEVKRLGLPTFCDADRDYFYALRESVLNKKCYGLLNIENRRSGKTYKGTCALYEAVTRMHDVIGGIQSKTNTDAKQVFKKLVKSWRKLPYYFKPVDSGETNPSGALRFEEPSRKSSKQQRKIYADVLDSEINYMPSKEESYDGAGLYWYYDDEFGKCLEARVDERWDIVKECLSDGAYITGKSLHTTTVEEMERKGGRYAKIMYDESDPNELNELGETINGLWRYFKPAFYGYRGEGDEGVFIDEYGYSEIEAAKEHLDKKRKGRSGSALASVKRKYPFDVKECWIADNATSPFDIDRIYLQMEHNSTLPASSVVRGNFIWVEKDVSAKFVHDDSGKWLVAWMPKEENRNKMVLKGGMRAPGNLDVVSGSDPFDHDKPTDLGKKSDAASHVLRKFDPFDPFNTGTFAAQYLARPDKAEIFYEDMIIQCVFYGCEILFENNKIGAINEFKRRGYAKYLMKRPEPTHTAYSKKRQKEYGIPMTGSEAREALVNAVQTFIYDHVGQDEEGNWGKMYFDDTLEDWAHFETDNWTPFDLTVSAGLTLLAAKKYVYEKKAPTEDRPSLVKRYRVTPSGRSVRVGNH